jgi:hypothetical protein
MACSREGSHSYHNPISKICKPLGEEKFCLMTTRADLRDRLRRRLEDTSAGSPLWDDGLLNDTLAGAVGQFGARFPAERTAHAPSMPGETIIAVTPYLEGREVLRVLDPQGRQVSRMRWEPAEPAWHHGQAWRWWDGSLVLHQPSPGGTWQVEYLARRALPDDDVSALDLRPGDEEPVVLLAASDALLRRAVELGKRGMDPSALALTRVAECHAREAERLMDARRRRAWGGWLGE